MVLFVALQFLSLTLVAFNKIGSIQNIYIYIIEDLVLTFLPSITEYFFLLLFTKQKALCGLSCRLSLMQ